VPSRLRVFDLPQVRSRKDLARRVKLSYSLSETSGFVRTMSTTFPTSALRSHLARLMEMVIHKNRRLVITRHGLPVAALLPMSDLEKLERYEARERESGRRQGRAILYGWQANEGLGWDDLE